MADAARRTLQRCSASRADLPRLAARPAAWTPHRMTTAPPPPPETVALEVEITLPDVEAFNLHVAFAPRLRARWRRQFMALYAGLAALLVGWNLLTFGPARFDWVSHGLAPLLILGALALVITPASYALHRWNVRRVVRAMIGRTPREDYLGRKRIEATAQGIAVTGANSANTYGWAAVTGLQETDTLLLVMLGDTLAIIVPKQGQDPARLAALRAMVRARAAGAG